MLRYACPSAPVASPLTRARSLLAQSDDGESSEDEEDDEEPEADADGSQGDEDEDDDGSRSSGRDAGDWYDVDDGFIDDSEFLDAAEVDERKAKHNGFFINKVGIMMRALCVACNGGAELTVSAGRNRVRAGRAS